MKDMVSNMTGLVRCVVCEPQGRMCWTCSRIQEDSP